MFKDSKRIIFLIAMLSISACAVLQPKTDEEQVLYLAQQRQNALLGQDYAKAYKYMSPGYRQLNTLQQFNSRYAGAHSWESADVYKTLCEEEICTAYVKVKFDAGALMGGGGRGALSKKNLLDRVTQETWVKLDNKWWFSKSN